MTKNNRHILNYGGLSPMIRHIFLAAMLLPLFAQISLACCDHCGCECEGRKICHLKCEMKPVTKHEYSCECEDFCVPCPSEKVGTTCQREIKHCLFGCKEVCREVPEYRPTGATVHTRKKLVKHEVTKMVPKYTWTVETVCDQCARQCLTCEPGQSRRDVEKAVLARQNTVER